MRRIACLLALLFAAVPAHAALQQIGGSATKLSVTDEGSFSGKVSSVNCTGTAITCTTSGNLWTLNINASAGGGGSGGALGGYINSVFVVSITSVNFTGSGIQYGIEGTSLSIKVDLSTLTAKDAAFVIDTTTVKLQVAALAVFRSTTDTKIDALYFYTSTADARMAAFSIQDATTDVIIEAFKLQNATVDVKLANLGTNSTYWILNSSAPQNRPFFDSSATISYLQATTFTLTNNGNTVFIGSNTGINTPNPTSALQVTGVGIDINSPIAAFEYGTNPAFIKINAGPVSDATAGILFDVFGTSYVFAGYNSGHGGSTNIPPHFFINYANQTDLFTMNNTGIGLGTNTPRAMLEVVGGIVTQSSVTALDQMVASSMTVTAGPLTIAGSTITFGAKQFYWVGTYSANNCLSLGADGKTVTSVTCGSGGGGGSSIFFGTTSQRFAQAASTFMVLGPLVSSASFANNIASFTIAFSSASFQNPPHDGDLLVINYKQGGFNIDVASAIADPAILSSTQVFTAAQTFNASSTTFVGSTVAIAGRNWIWTSTQTPGGGDGVLHVRDSSFVYVGGDATGGVGGSSDNPQTIYHNAAGFGMGNSSGIAVGTSNFALVTVATAGYTNSYINISSGALTNFFDLRNGSFTVTVPTVAVNGVIVVNSSGASTIYYDVHLATNGSLYLDSTLSCGGALQTDAAGRITCGASGGINGQVYIDTGTFRSIYEVFHTTVEVRLNAFSTQNSTTDTQIEAFKAYFSTAGAQVLTALNAASTTSLKIDAFAAQNSTTDTRLAGFSTQNSTTDTQVETFKANFSTSGSQILVALNAASTTSVKIDAFSAQNSTTDTRLAGFSTQNSTTDTQVETFKANFSTTGAQVIVALNAASTTSVKIDAFAAQNSTADTRLSGFSTQNSTTDTQVEAFKAQNSTTDAHITTVEIRASTMSGSGGTINAASNALSWTQLKDVPAGFADGTDDGAGGATSGDNFGSHVATKPVNMAGFSIYNSSGLSVGTTVIAFVNISTAGSAQPFVFLSSGGNGGFFQINTASITATVSSFTVNGVIVANSTGASIISYDVHLATNGSLFLDSILTCSGALQTDSSGRITCGAAGGVNGQVYIDTGTARAAYEVFHTTAEVRLTGFSTQNSTTDVQIESFKAYFSTSGSQILTALNAASTTSVKIDAFAAQNSTADTRLSGFSSQNSTTDVIIEAFKAQNSTSDVRDNNQDIWRSTTASAGGTINAASNALSWTQLKDVPAGFADGTDDGAGGGTSPYPTIRISTAGRESEITVTTFNIILPVNSSMTAYGQGGASITIVNALFKDFNVFSVKLTTQPGGMGPAIDGSSGTWKLKFSSTVDNACMLQTVLPPSYNANMPTYIDFQDIISTAVSGTVAWDTQVMAIHPGSAVNQLVDSFDTKISSSLTVEGTSGMAQRVQIQLSMDAAVAFDTIRVTLRRDNTPAATARGSADVIGLVIRQ